MMKKERLADILKSLTKELLTFTMPLPHWHSPLLSG
ncbi:MAG: hypothetical protein ACJA13_000172 [Paraglaciecola sp.]|jgi:hypothetical protein